jgi:maleylacetate reductase
MDFVIYGKPAAEALREEAERLDARRVFLIVSRTLNTKTDEIEKIRASLRDRYAGTFDGIPQHTTREVVVQAAARAREAEADLIVAIGGGSVVDAAKIILMCIEHEIADQDGLDGYETTPERRFGQFRDPKVRMIAIPSTLSGGEYNSGSLVTDTRRKLKQIFNHPMMMPRTIILDPGITRYTPEKLWLGSGTRAMDHGIEAICSIRGNPPWSIARVSAACGFSMMACCEPRRIPATSKRASTVNSGPGCRLSGCRRAFQWEPAMPSVTFSGEPATCRIISVRR